MSVTFDYNSSGWTHSAGGWFGDGISTLTVWAVFGLIEIECHFMHS